MHIGIPKPPGLSSAGSPSPRSPSPLNPGKGPYIELDDMKDDEPRGYHQPDAGFQTDVRQLDHQQSGQLEDVVNNWWLFELLAWAISAIAMVVLVVTLFLTDDRPLPHWPMKITLNSFISILATIIKAAMIVPVAEGISQLKWLWFKKAGVLKDIQTFDEASRGMWGSVKLLMSTKGVHLAKLGAFLTVFSLAVDPFIQQVVTYPNRRVLSPLNSTVPIGQMYDDYTFGGIQAVKNPSLSMKSAISSGLFDTNNNPLNDFGITPYCPTGNCTWTDPYRSLAVCSKCANITESLTKKCDDDDSSSFSSYGPTCTWSLPNGFMLKGYGNPLATLNVTGTYDSNSINFNGTQATISIVQTIRGIHDAATMNTNAATAMECVLYWCVEEYTADVTAGHFTERVVNQYTNSTMPGVTDNTTITPPNADKPFVVEFVTRNAIGNYLGTYWTGNYTQSRMLNMPSNDVADALFQLGDDGSGYGYPKPNGENTTFAAIAKSMTRLLRTQAAAAPGSSPSSSSAAIRNSGLSEAGVARGAAWETETYVHVRWWWLSLPAALLALTLVFLLGTILRSAASGVAVWKSSTLALLQIRLVDEERAQGGGLREWGTGKLAELNRWAGGSQVRLQRSETGAELHLSRKL